MAALLIKDVPSLLHQKLKQIAVQHRRSMNQEALVLLEGAVSQASLLMKLKPAFKGRFKLDDTFINRAKRIGRS